MFSEFFQKGLFVDDIETDAMITDRIREKLVKKLKKKAAEVRGRGVIDVPKPYPEVEPIGTMYEYAALQAFDRRQFLKQLDEDRELRMAGKNKESRIKSAEVFDETDPTLVFFAQHVERGVTRDDLVKNCSALNLSEPEAHRLFDRLDINGDGEVDRYEFGKVIIQIENNATANIIAAICEGDAGRLQDGLMKHSKTHSFVDKKRLNLKCTVNPKTGEGTMGSYPLINLPNQNGDLGRRLGGDVDRRIPRCSHVATEELEIKALGIGGHGISSGLFMIEGDTLLHTVMRNAHLSHRVEMAEVLLSCGADPNAISSDGKKPYELDLQGKRHVWKREMHQNVGMSAEQVFKLKMI
jgi:hypothetical protein